MTKIKKIIRLRKIFDDTEIFSLAKSYKFVAGLANNMQEKIDKAIKENNITYVLQEFMFIRLVEYVNISFSCELIFKALTLKKYSKKSRGHKLDKLFLELDSNLQQEIKNETINLYNDNEDFLDFDNEIRENADIFEKLRYFYEGNINYNIKFIQTLNNVLISICKKIIPQNIFYSILNI